MAAATWAEVIAILLLLLRLAPLSSSSSMVFELTGNVYPLGYFFVTMSIGEPAKPYFLHVDTGSGLTWLDCGPVGNQRPRKAAHEFYIGRRRDAVRCEDERCVAMHRDLNILHDCTKYPDRCSYDISYGDQYSTMGYLLTDKFSLPTTNDRPNLAFGCGVDKVNDGNDKPMDGLLGIGRGTADLVSQLRQQGFITENVIGHCLGIHGGGYLFFGGDNVPSTGVTWLPMLQYYMIVYSPGKVTLSLDVQLKYELGTTPTFAVFDSGSTYSYVHKTTYEHLIKAVEITLQGSSLQKVPDDDSNPHQCWRYNEPIQSVDDVKHEFKPLELSFAHGANQVTLDIPPENYIFVTEGGSVCLGILDGTKDGQEFDIIGDITMQNHLVIYDNERARIGWVRASCDEMPGSGPIFASRL